MEKCIQGIQFLSAQNPGITQYYIGKVFFFADRAHLRDWGRTISGDRYVAMEHGPVPSTIYDLLKSTSGEPDEIADRLWEVVKSERDGNKIRVFSLEKEPKCPALSSSDKDYLLKSLNKYGRKSFSEIKDISHKDPAYEAAWSGPGLNNEMDLRLWFEESPEELSELLEIGPVKRRA
jgi:uncharacterized phage-associated protein